MFHKSYWGQLGDLNFTHCKGDGDTLLYIHRTSWKVSFQTFLLSRASMPSGTLGGGWSEKSLEYLQNRLKGYRTFDGHLLLFMDLGSSISCPTKCATSTKCDSNTFKCKLDYFLWQVPVQPCINWFQTIYCSDIARPPNRPLVILFGTPEVGLAPLTCGCWPINSISANIGHRNSIRILNQYLFWWNILIRS